METHTSASFLCTHIRMWLFFIAKFPPYDNNCSNLSNKYALRFPVCTWHRCHENVPQTGDITLIEMALALLKMNLNKQLPADISAAL